MINLSMLEIPMFQAKLESRLSQLYRQLMLLNQSLHSIVQPKDQKTNQEKAFFDCANGEKTTLKSSKKESASGELPKCLYARLATQGAKTCNMLKDITQDLLTLSILVPSAPWVSDVIILVCNGSIIDNTEQLMLLLYPLYKCTGGGGGYPPYYGLVVTSHPTRHIRLVPRRARRYFIVLTIT